MNIATNAIIKNINHNEPVRIIDVQDFGDDLSIEYVGINSGIRDTIIYPKSDLALLEQVSQQGEFSFTGNPEKFVLYTEAERIKSAYLFDPLFAVNCSIVDPLPHQVEAVYNFMLPLPRMRFLLADDTGAGKTIMTGLLIKELILRGLLERILIITPGGLTKQWQEDELGLKFNFDFKLVDRPAYNSDPNIFNTSNKLVTSIDFIRNEDVIKVLKDCTWDLVVVDEAHKLSAYDYGTKKYISKRYEALSKIAPQTEHLLLLTATPHRGRQDTFRNLLQLLDQDIFATNDLVTDRINQEGGDDVTNRFFLRRLKEDMTDWEGNPLFKPRHTKTVEYELTKDEKTLYDRVTRYLTKRRAEATEQRNIHVTLALMVMQRRLTSSIYAIMKTLKNRYNALDGLVKLVRENPSLWKQRSKMEMEFEDFDDYSELTDEEREAIEHIFSDPKKFKLFTTAKDIKEVEQERNEVRELVDLAESLYNSQVEEQKLKKLYEFLKDHHIIDGKKLVIFTEHKDTLDYLVKKLEALTYKVETIYGQKSVNERRLAQDNFAADSQILIATDAAGEGINLQFCNLLINWDIPWNPNRLEQRMGRVHRYGQEEEVFVFNLVAKNTREGKVMARLLTKLEIIREQIGSDRVYDVISDVFEGVDINDIINSVMEDEITPFNEAIDNELTAENVKDKIDNQKQKLSRTQINFAKAKNLMDDSLEKRLIPIYLRRFFIKAYTILGGKIVETEDDFIKLQQVPDAVRIHLKKKSNISYAVEKLVYTFDKKVFLDKKKTGKYEQLHYLNPGNPIYDAIVQIVINSFKEEVLKGTVLISPEDTEPYFAHFVKSQIIDQTPNRNTADEVLRLVYGMEDYKITSPAKLIDLVPPDHFTKKVEVPPARTTSEVEKWSYKNITVPQFTMASERIKEDLEDRKKYLEEGIDSLIFEYTAELSSLREKVFNGNLKAQDKMQRFEDRIEELQQRREQRVKELNARMLLSKKPPAVLGSAYVIPLSDVEFKSHYGMTRDDEVEAIAMQVAMDYEVQQGWDCKDVSGDNVGFDLKSISPNLIKRYIEVKGRAADGGVMISENEMNRLRQLGTTAWLYVVNHCKSKPQLHRIQNPGNVLQSEVLSKGIQYFVKEQEWKNKALQE
ncbi:MAG: helicase [Croceibacter sp.]|nr:helicase [Croceibacter sp.]